MTDTATHVDSESIGLRERKRRATRRAIQMAVIELVADRGLDATTVDEISRRADVSPRTFFNYFASKEDAVIGDLPELPADDLVESFVTAGPGTSLLDGLAEIIVATIESDNQDQELMHRRRDVLQQYPQLFAIRIGRMRQVEEELAGIVARRLRADDAALDADPGRAMDRARLIAYVSFATMRHAWGSWASGSPTAQLADQVTTSFDELKSLLASEPV